METKTLILLQEYVENNVITRGVVRVTDFTNLSHNQLQIHFKIITKDGVKDKHISVHMLEILGFVYSKK